MDVSLRLVNSHHRVCGRAAAARFDIESLENRLAPSSNAFTDLYWALEMQLGAALHKVQLRVEQVRELGHNHVLQIAINGTNPVLHGEHLRIMLR